MRQVNDRHSERFYRIGDNGWETAIIPRGALIVGVGALAEPRGTTPGPRISDVDWMNGRYRVGGAGPWLPIPSNHIRANEVDWRPYAPKDKP